MIYSPRILDVLQSLERTEWRGVVYRHMFSSYPPQRANTSGARWNPRGVAAIYVSCDRETALAEAEHQIAVQPIRPRTRRTLWRIQVALANVLDFTRPGILRHLGIDEGTLSSLELESCQEVGGAAAWLGNGGLLVPSARRRDGVNLVVYGQDPATPMFEVLDSELLENPERST